MRERAHRRPSINLFERIRSLGKWHNTGQEAKPKGTAQGAYTCTELALGQLIAVVLYVTGACSSTLNGEVSQFYRVLLKPLS